MKVKIVSLNKLFFVDTSENGKDWENRYVEKTYGKALKRKAELLGIDSPLPWSEIKNRVEASHEQATSNQAQYPMTINH